MRKLTAILLTSVAFIAACSTDPDEPASTDTTSVGTTAVPDGGAEPEVPEVPDDPRAPGVTEDTITVGVTYPDLGSVEGTLGINHGDYEVAFRAVADALNARGAFGSRQIELVFAPVDPRVSDAATAACTLLAEEAQVFVAVGFFQGDDVLCYVDTHEVPVIGGSMSDERLAQAAAPWFTLGSTQDLQSDAVAHLIEADVLGDAVAVVGTTEDVPLFEGQLAPMLDEAGIDVIGPAFIDNSSGDPNIVNAATDTILERFEAEGAERVLVIGNSATIVVPGRVSAGSYSPQLIFTDEASLSAFVQGEGSDLSSLEGAIATGTFGDNERFDELDDPETTECVQILNDAGHTMVPLDEVPEGELRNAVSGFEACKNLYLLAAIVSAAGDPLDYGTFRRAGYGLGAVPIPGYPDPPTFGPPPSADGDVSLLLYRFDQALQAFVSED